MQLGRSYDGEAEIVDAIFRRELKERVATVLRTLTPLQEKVIKMRLGLEDGNEHTPEETGHSFAVTADKIRQIQASVLRKLRHPSRSRKLRPFAESLGV